MSHVVPVQNPEQVAASKEVFNRLRKDTNIRRIKQAM
jgi:hypothetical protein